jgi:hypothetical protein
LACAPARADGEEVETLTGRATGPGITVSQRALAGLLAKGERAVFHGPPGGAIPALTEAIAVATAADRFTEATAAGWLLGVAQAACGKYGTALVGLDRVMEPARNPDAAAPELLFGALAAATMASVHRQLGRHEVAWEYDAFGLSVVAIASGLDEAVFDCRLGLASDAVGLGNLDIARIERDHAAELVGVRGDWWRQRVRLDWLDAEIALLAGDPATALDAAHEAIDRAELSKAPRHVAKGLLFAGVAEAHAGAPEMTATLWRAATLADQLGAAPLIWRARSILGAMLIEDDPVTSARSLQAARSAVLGIAADLPVEIREEWLVRPDIEVLLSM